MTNFLLVTSNGTGMGHLTRQLALAMSTRPPDRATIFSLSRGAPLVSRLGIPFEYCPSYDLPWLESRSWNSYLRDRLIAITEETKSEVIIFDGVAPYVGLAYAAWQMRHVEFVWLRRGMWKEANSEALRMTRSFSSVIEPGDLASGDDTGPTSRVDDAVRVGPISILEPMRLLARDEARRQLGLPLDDPVALVTLGSGMLGDVEGPGRAAVRTLLERSGRWRIAMTKSPVARDEVSVGDAERLTMLRGVYPLAQYLAAFDLAISSAGYNAVHELVPAAVPSVLVANTSTQTDDQVTRATSVEKQGLALAGVDTDPEGIVDKIHVLDDDTKRAGLGARARTTASLLTGASETISRVSSRSQDLEGRPRTSSEATLIAVEHAKNVTRRVIGDRATQGLKRLMGRPTRPVYAKTRVTLADATGGGDARHPQLAVVPTVSIEELDGDQPIEHVPADTSPDYQRSRRRLIDRYYDVAGD